MIDTSLIHLLTKAVRENLQQKVRGNVTVKTIKDTMYIDISPNSAMSFRYTIENLFDKAIKGVTSQMLADECLKSYSRYINCQIFKQKSVDKHKNL